MPVLWEQELSAEQIAMKQLNSTTASMATGSGPGVAVDEAGGTLSQGLSKLTIPTHDTTPTTNISATSSASAPPT